MAAHNHNPNPAVSAEQYRLAQAVLSGTARESSMPVSVAREIVGRTPARLRSEYSRNPVYGMDLDLETTMAPAWKYYDSKAARDAHARLKEGEGQKVVLGHSMFGFKEGGGKKWRMRLADHRGNPSKAFGGDVRQQLLSAVTQYDMKEQEKAAKRGPRGYYNMYALPQYLGRVSDVVKDIEAGAPVRKALTNAFTGRLLDVTLKAVGEPRSTKEEQRGGPITYRSARENPGAEEVSLWGYHRITGSWKRLQGPSDTVTMEQYLPYFAKETLAQYYANTPHSGFANDQRPVYESLVISRKAPREKKNPQPAADDMYASFHGEPSDETIEIAGEEHYHSHLAALGELVELKVKLVNGGTAVIGFETGASDDEVENPFWSSAHSTASKISGSVLAGLKRAAASRKERARWIPYATTDSEVRAQAKAGYLEAHDVSARVEKRKIGGVFSRKYKFDVMVDREQLREMFKRSAGEKRASRGSRVGGSKPAGAYKGYQIREVEGGFAVPKLDPTGTFTSKADAKEFIDYSMMGAKVKNPGPFHEAGKLIGRGTRAAQRPMNDFIGAAGKVGGYLDDELGRALNPSPSSHDTGPAYLTANEDGTQLFIVGGDQSLDLPGLGITGPQAEKELVTIGTVTNVVYHAHKIFDGKREEYDYTHKLSEDTHGPLPVLIYDRINQQLKLSGGEYKIERPLVGTSPGIEN